MVKEEVKEESKEEESNRKEKTAPDEEKEVDYEILDRKYPIKEWKTEGDDLNAVYQLVRDQISKMRLPGGFDRVLWGLDELWVHTLMTEAGLVIHMLIEKKYHLRKKVLLQMLKLKLESEEDSTMQLSCLDLSRRSLKEFELKTLMELRWIFECWF
ncbi:hypothetical protein Tco_0773769 [Tanacetum coccineum]|uniref:Uncharacterized protein n=1 Tax=Tanacetum coccineum TaxID=301880 RepID=A0ABQ4ZQU8_9ASTR